MRRKDAKISRRPINRGNPARIETCLFVYGTLRKSARYQLHRTLAREARFAGKAYFQGRLYNLGRYPGAVTSRNKSDRIVGDMYRLREPAPLFKRLDDYEGEHFARQRMPVHLGTGKRIISWVYLYRGRVKDAQRIRSGDYLDFLARP